MKNLIVGCILTVFLGAVSCGCSKDKNDGNNDGPQSGVTVKPKYNKSRNLRNPLSGWVMYCSADYDPSYWDTEFYITDLGENVKVADYA